MKCYFVADVHLGSRTFENPKEVEQNFIDWLRMAAEDADAIFLLGDIFDFWFEFARSVPPGFDNVLSAMKEISSSGVRLYFVPGNHDQWTFGFLSDNCGINVLATSQLISLDNRSFFIAHGHGLGEKRTGAKIINTVFESRVCRWLFRNMVPPRLGLAFGYRWSAGNRSKHDRKSQERHIDYYSPHNTDNDVFQVEWAKQFAEQHTDTDYIIMGHLHQEINMRLKTGTQLLVLDEFYSHYGYAVYDGTNLYPLNFL